MGSDMNNRLLAIAMLALGAIAASALAQHHGHGHGPAISGGQTSGHGGHQMPADTREAVAIPPEMAQHMMANMRDHLAALQEIQDALAKGESDRAARVAEHRLGLSSLQAHGAHHVGKFMPQGMRDAGTGMHRAASRFAVAAQESGVTGDLKAPLATLAEVTAQCVGCHAGYKLK